MALASAGALPALANPAPGEGSQRSTVRVIVDNDFGGDPDGLFLLAQLALSRSVALPLVIGSQYRDFGEADRVPDKGQASARKARELLRFLPPAGRPPVIAGTDAPLRRRDDGRSSPASAAIIRAAMADDHAAPLFYAAGGGLTELALAWLAEPAIARRLTLVWIGGAEHPGMAEPPPGRPEPEYNFSLDPLAAQIIFNESDIPVWQVPRNAFRQMLVSRAELDELARTGPLGRYLRDQAVATEHRLGSLLPPLIFSAGETVMLGDTALVTLTALRSPFQPDAASSAFDLIPTPTLGADGSYVANPAGRPMRVYRTIDAGLTWRDFMAKLRRR